MSQTKLVAAVALLAGTATLALSLQTLAAAKSPHDFSGSLSGEFSTNEDVNVARASADQWDFASFEDFDEAEADDVESEEETDEFGDDFDDVGLDDSDLSEDEFELSVDDDDGDGGDDDVDNDGVDNAQDLDDDEGGVDLDPVTGEATRNKTKSDRASAELGLAYKYRFNGGKVVWGSNLRLVTDYNNNHSEKNKDNYAFTTGPEFNIKSMRLKIKPAVSWLRVHQHVGRNAGRGLRIQQGAGFHRSVQLPGPRHHRPEFT